MIHRYAPVLLLIVMAPSWGTDIFKWVDENGKVHYGDSPVSEPHRGSKRVEVHADSLTQAQREEAHARVAAEKLNAERIAIEKQKKNETQVSSSAPPEKRNINVREQCEEEKRLYEESGACFAPFRLVGGGIKAEAFKHCTQIKRPHC